MSGKSLFFQYDLVCGDEWKISFISTSYLFGVLFGAPLSGILSDRSAPAMAAVSGRFLVYSYKSFDVMTLLFIAS